MPADRTLDEGATSRCLALKRAENQKRFRQPAANRIDDANRRVAGKRQQLQMGWASKKQRASLAYLSQGNRGLGPSDNTRVLLLEHAPLLTKRKDFKAEVIVGAEECGEAGEKSK